MAKIIDMTGYTIGKLTVIKRVDDHLNQNRVIWLCQCECGNTTNVYSHSLRRKKATNSCGCLKKTHFIDLTGQKFNSLTILKHLGKDNERNQIYLAKCDCGAEINAQGSDIKTGKIKTCGCGRFRASQIKYLEDPDFVYEKSLYRAYEHGAMGRDYEFKLTLEQFTKLINDNCYYCGIVPSNVHQHSKRRKCEEYNEPYLYSGIDRVNNDVGYIPENCVSCCKACNIAKHLMTQEAFIDMAYRIVETDIKRKS
jgi:hypothetical protein